MELNSSMFLGGITPSIGAVKTAKKAGISIMAMVRPREGGFCYTDLEFEAMLVDAADLMDAGADGIVFGILLPDGTVDKTRCAQMMQVINSRGKASVFHRAIDVVPDWKQALDTLCELGVTRVLTSGQNPNVYFGAATVKAMVEYASGRIEILPGAGLTLENSKKVLEITGCRQMHIALPKTCVDSSTSHNSDIYFGGALYPPEDKFSMTDAAKVAQLVDILAK